MIIYNKLDNYFFVSADRQTFLGFEIPLNLCDTCEASQGTGNKSLLGQNVIFLSGLCFYLKMIPKWFFRHAKVPRDLNKWKITSSKFGQNWSNLALSPLPPPEEKSRFLDPQQIFMKKVPIDSACPKTSLWTLVRPPKGPGTKKSPTRDEVTFGSKRKFFVRALFLLKDESQVIFSTRRGP